MTRDADAIRRILNEQTLDLRHLDVAGFRRWLGLQLARWEHDPVFCQRVVIRDLRRSHPGLQAMEVEHRRAQSADAAGPHVAQLREVEEELAGARKAVAGLTAASAAAPPGKQPGLGAKRAGFQTRIRVLEEEHAALVAASPERQSLLHAERELASFRHEIGLDREEARLAELQAHHGKRPDRAGRSFEQTAEALILQALVPELAPTGGVRLLRGVRLGAARLELDLLLVRTPEAAGEAVEALAVVEAKRNVNDLAHGFTHRQEDLTWLTGDRHHYDPATFRTRSFPTGHFDRAATHLQDGGEYRIGPESFRRFHRDPETGYFLDQLYLVTRPGWVWGVSAGGVARIGARVATDEEWNPDNEAYLTELLAWSQGLARPIESPDVLQLFAATPKRARQVIWQE